MRDGMSFATHIRQSARGAAAVQAMKIGGEEAFKAAMAAPPGELPAIYTQIKIYYITNRQTVVGPEVTVQWPRYSTVMDYELEVAAITKRTRANIPSSEGAEHIFGYTIFNDFSARDRQSLEMQGRLGPAKGKSFDGSNAMGPWIVTADELGDLQTLKVEVPGQRRDSLYRLHERDAVLFRGVHRRRLAGRDDPGRRSVRLRHRRELLRAGDRPLSG
jgi:Fumarylacetoacetate (FAA) hydrolase family